jgi:hypothetical protein
MHPLGSRSRLIPHIPQHAYASPICIYNLYPLFTCFVEEEIPCQNLRILVRLTKYGYSEI